MLTKHGSIEDPTVTDAGIHSLTSSVLTKHGSIEDAVNGESHQTETGVFRADEARLH